MILFRRQLEISLVLGQPQLPLLLMLGQLLFEMSQVLGQLQLLLFCQGPAAASIILSDCLTPADSIAVVWGVMLCLGDSSGISTGKLDSSNSEAEKQPIFLAEAELL